MKTDNPVALIVDDNDVVRSQLRRALADEGIASDMAVDGEDALRKFARRQYSVVVTDMRMPKVHGHALAVQLLELPYPPRIVAVTAVTDRRLTKDLKARGVDEVFYKPLNYYGLAATAKRLIGEEEARQAASDQSNSTTDMQIVPQHSWMQFALDYIDWRRIPNPLSVVQDLARSSSPNESANSPALVKEIAIVVGVGENHQPIGVPVKAMMRMLATDHITLFHSTKLDFANAAVLWRSRHGGRAMAMLNNLQYAERPGGWEIEGDVAGADNYYDG